LAPSTQKKASPTRLFTPAKSFILSRVNQFFCTYRVSYRDCTIGDHVYYSRYLEILEVARGEFFRHLGWGLRQLQEQGIAFPVAECRLRYHAPARYDDQITVRLWLTQARGARLTFACRVEDQSGRLVLEAETFHACVDRDSRPRRLPAELVPVLVPYLVPSAH
jgi:acyl-CoA thioester hydrolase